MLSENAKNWKSTGLLDNLDEIDCEILTQNLIETGWLLIREHEINNQLDELKSVLLLSIISRLFRSGHRILNIEGLYNNFSTWFRENRLTIEIIGDLDACELYYEYICTDNGIEQFFPK